MASESGDMKLIGNFSKLLELVSNHPDYNPANVAIKVPTLNTQKAAGLVAVADLGAKEAPYERRGQRTPGSF